MNELGLYFAYLFAAILGYGLVSWLMGVQEGAVALRICLAPGAGMAFISAVMLLQLVFLNALPLAVSVALVFMSFFILVIKSPGSFRVSFQVASRHGRMLLALGLLALVLILFKMAKSPYGAGLDVWAIWHMKARFIFRAWGDWRLIFSEAMDFSHPDYPLLYPLSLVWGWFLGGAESIRASQLIAISFTLGCIGLIYEYFKLQQYKFPALAALLLISTPHFIGMGASQYADILVAYFYLAAVVLFLLSERLLGGKAAIVAGLFAGAAPFVKNEGLLFCPVFVGVLLANKNRMAKNFFLGALPGLVVTAIFKWAAASPSQQITGEGLLNLTQPDVLATKAALIARAFFEQMLNENSWVYGLLYVAAVVVLCPKHLGPKKRRELFGLLTLMLCFYLGYYGIAPSDTVTLLHSSLDRLLLHLYPLFVLFSMEIASELWYDFRLWTNKSGLEKASFQKKAPVTLSPK